LSGNPRAAFEGNYSQRDVMQKVRATLRKYKDLRISVRTFPSFNIGGGNFDIDFVVRGPELVKLSEYTERLRDMVVSGEVPGITDADTTLKLNKPELRVSIDRDRAADLRVTAQDVGTALRLMVGGDEQISRFRDPTTNEDYDVQLRLTEQDRSGIADIPRLLLPGANGRLVELRNLASVDPSATAARVDRWNRQRAANLRAGIAPGYALADRIEALRGAVNTLNLPPEYSVTVAGRGRELQKTFVEFLWAFLLSIVFMYMILAANYESLVHPFTILLSLPLCLPFALLALYLTDGSLNLYSALGILVLFGVVKKNSILQIDHMNHLRQAGMNRYDAIIQGNRDRLRPILMTTLALVGGMLPLALGTGPGAEERRAVAVVVIGGQTLSLLLTLLVTPVAYSLLDDMGRLINRRKKNPGDPEPETAAQPVDEPELVGAVRSV
jgi:HAE1 family hydrophobic/amphiphilic exporter-1